MNWCICAAQDLTFNRTSLESKRDKHIAISDTGFLLIEPVWNRNVNTGATPYHYMNF